MKALSIGGNEQLASPCRATSDPDWESILWPHCESVFQCDGFISHGIIRQLKGEMMHKLQHHQSSLQERQVHADTTPESMRKR